MDVMDVNFIAVIAAAVAMFIVGAIWYGVIFGKQWGKIHGFDKLSEKQQKEMQSKMLVPYIGQYVVTFLTAWALAFFIQKLPDVGNGVIAFWVWLGFMIPTLYGAVTFGGAPEGKAIEKFVISAGGTLAPLLTAAWILNLFS